jgi:putative peptidoglycan lipid II flippase
MLVQLPLALSLGFRPSLQLNFKLPGLKEIARLMPPRALALGVDQIENLVAVTFASTLAGNSLSVLNIARLLYMIPASLFGVTIGQAAFPALTRQSAEGDQKKFVDTFISALHQVVFLALPISVLFIVLRIPVVRLVFGAKSFPWEATVLTGWTLAILTLAATFAAALQLISRGFYSLHDTKTPLYTGLVAAVVGSLFSYLATQVFGLGVLGLAGVIAATGILETSTLLFLVSSRLKISKSRLIPPLIKMGITALVMGVSLYLPMKLLDNFVFDTTRTIPLIALTGITTSIGMIVYFLLSYLFGVSELYTFLNLLNRVKNLRSFLKTPHQTPVTVTPPDQS